MKKDVFFSCQFRNLETKFTGIVLLMSHTTLFEKQICKISKFQGIKTFYTKYRKANNNNNNDKIYGVFSDLFLKIA